MLRYSTGPFKVFTDFDEKVSQMTISPFLNLNAIQQVMKNSSAVILCGYGMGNLPTGNQSLMNIINDAVKDGVIVVIKT